MRYLSGLAVFLAVAVLIDSLPAGDIHTGSQPRIGYEYWIPASETDSAGQHGIHFKKFINGSAYMPRFPFRFQRWDEPQLGELKKRLGLEKLIKDASTEFEIATRIAHKVCNLWAHSAPVEYPSWNALKILDEVGQGEQYWCTYKQLLTMQCLASLGIHSRIVPCHWHHSLEFWSNDFRKWVVMDAWTANYYRKDGIPLGSLELHRLSRETGGVEGTGVWEININPNRWKPERTQDSVLATTDCYQHVRFIPRNDFLSAPLEPKPVGAPGDYLKPNNQLNDVIQTALIHIAWWQPGDAPTIVCPMVRYEQDYNFPLNEVEITFSRPATQEGVLDLSFQTHTPEFDSYFRKLDDGDWETCGSRFLWELEPGTNSLKVKSRSRWGRFGSPSEVVLEYRPEELRAPVVERLEIPDPGFEKIGGNTKSGDGQPTGTWKMIYTDRYQEPAFYGPVNENPHSGKYCFKIELRNPPIYARLQSGRFRVNPASDVTFTVWLRADKEAREVTLSVSDVTRGGPGSQAKVHHRARVGTKWKQYELKARLTARTTEAAVGVQLMKGVLWMDDFSITEHSRAEIPW